MDKNIYTLLEQLRPRPVMWLGAASISRLWCFLNGFTYAQLSYDPQAFELPPFGLLHDWTAARLNHRYSTAGWCQMLLEACHGDEAAALQLFFEYLDEFRRVRALRILEVRLRPENLAFHQADTRAVRRYGAGPLTEANRLPAPEQVNVIQFSGGLGYYTLQRRKGLFIAQDGPFASLRAALKSLRREFGPTLHWQDSPDLSAEAVATLLRGELPEQPRPAGASAAV